MAFQQQHRVPNYAPPDAFPCDFRIAKIDLDVIIPHHEDKSQQGEDMNATLQLFNQFKQTLGVHTDNAGALALGVKTQTVSNWRTRGSQAEPRLIEAMCSTVGADLVEWLLRVQVEQAVNIPNRDAWRKAGKQLGYKLGSIGVFVGFPAAESIGVGSENWGIDALCPAFMALSDTLNFSLAFG